MTREATKDDWPDVLALMRECNDASAYTEAFDDKTACYMFGLSITNPGFACFVTDNVDGFIYLALTPAHFNFSVTYANELGFWGKGGKELVERAAQWAAKMGAVRFRMASEDCIKGHVMDRWYRKAGFEQTGRTHTMMLEAPNGH